MPSIEVDITLDDFDDDDILDEARARGFNVTDQQMDDFDREEFLFLIDMLDKMPFNWYTNRIRDKLLKAAHG